MFINYAKAIAREWISEEATILPGFFGAFFHGSTVWLADDAILPPSSDVDIMVVLSGEMPTVKLGKFRYQSVLLEVSYLATSEVQSPEQVLGNSHLAGSFRNNGILADPSGKLSAIQAVVGREFAKEEWVHARCEHVQEKLRNNLAALETATLFHDQVSCWLFATGLTTHMLLVAGLKNPTVRTRYVATKHLLQELGHNEFYEPLLALLGCSQITPARCTEHLAALSRVFDVASSVIKTPFFFASDLSDEARAIAIDGSQTLIDAGLHREAIFWLVATYARCQMVLYHDAPVEVQEQFQPGFRALLGDLGIQSADDLRSRGAQVEAFLPRLWEMTEAIRETIREIAER